MARRNITTMRQGRLDRSYVLAELRAVAAGQADPLDVVVIGGGVTGAGVALDAAARGLHTALVERGDFASGTSSKSSKMVHGGLRYLQNGEVRLVYEALRERRRLMRNAPHLVEVLPFLIPIMTRDGVIKKKIARALGSAMWMYDLTGGWRIGRLHRRASAEESAAHFPTCHTETLSAGYVYYDAFADDARLTLTIARTASDRGALVINYTPVVGLTHGSDGHVDGVHVRLDNEVIRLPCRSVVNATGVWADEIRAMADPDNRPQIRPARGVHIAIPWEMIRNDIAVIIPSARDKRSVFLMPWGENADGTFRHTYIGTTDTDHDGGLDNPQCGGDDIDYLLAAVNAATTSSVSRSDVTGVWSGLRPLVRSTDEQTAKTADLSRRHVVQRGDDGVISINGGKLTTYRAMAEDTMDAVVAELPDAPRAWRRHVTSRLRLVGSGGYISAPRGTVDHHLGRRFGSDAPELRALCALDPSLNEPLVEGQPYLRAEAVYAVRHEMAIHLDDVLERRTRAHLFDRAATMKAAPGVADLLARELDWSPDQRAAELEHYEAICQDEEEASTTRADVAHTAD